VKVGHSKAQAGGCQLLTMTDGFQPRVIHLVFILGTTAQYSFIYCSYLIE